MKRRAVGVFLLLGSIVASAGASAQMPDRVYKLGVVNPASALPETFTHFTLPELAQLGFVEGRNLRVEGRFANGDATRLPSLAGELVAAGVDLIVADGSAAVRAAAAATNALPIVMAFGGEDPVAAGWAESLARPGRNITGIVVMTPELAGKRLQLLQEALPAARRLSVMVIPAAHDPYLPAIRQAAAAAVMQLQEVAVSGPIDYAGAFERMRQAGTEALWLAGSPAFFRDAAPLAALAAEAKLPTLCEGPHMAARGCFLGYGPDFRELRRGSASYIARILHGAAPGNLPIEQPARFQLAINLHTAKQLGITVPDALLARADEVIE